MAWTLCSKDDVTNLFPIAEADLKDDWSMMVEAMIRQYMGQPSLGEIDIVVNDYYDGDGTALLRLRKTPIMSIQSLSIDGLTLSSGDYVVYPTHVVLLYHTFTKGRMNILVSYTAGTTSVDPVVRLAATSMIIAMINYQRKAGSDASLKWGVDNTKVGEPSPNVNIGLGTHLNKIMKNILKRPRVMVR